MPKNVQRHRWGSPNGEFWNNTRRKAIKILRLSGYSYEECAEVFRVSVYGCRCAVARYKLTNMHRSPEERLSIRQKIRQLARPGISDRAIAEILIKDGHDIDKQGVRFIRNRLGIPSGCGWGGKRIKGTNPKV